MASMKKEKEFNTQSWNDSTFYKWATQVSKLSKEFFK
jgi:hypothetical protein